MSCLLIEAREVSDRRGQRQCDGDEGISSAERHKDDILTSDLNEIGNEPISLILTKEATTASFAFAS